MATPLKIKDGSGNIQEFTTSEESYIAYQIGLQLADASVDSAGALNKSSLGTNIGSYSNTFFNEPVGTHPSTNISTGTATTPIFQTTGTADEGDSDWQRPLMWVDAGGETGFKQMPDLDLNQAIDRYLTTVFTNNYPGSFKLGSSSPGPDYSVHLPNAFTDTRTDGTSVQYNIYKRDTITPPAAVRPIYARDNGSFDGVQAMTDRQIKTTFGQRAKTRIMSSGIGTYQLRSATQGAPSDPGTWVSAGSATDTKQTTSDVVYQIDSTVNFVAAYVRNYQSAYVTNFTSVSGINYTKSYSRAQFAANYSTVFTRVASESFAVPYSTNYTNVYVKPYTKAYTGTYNKVYTGNYVNNYATNFIRNTLVNYQTNYTGTYNKVYTGNYQNNYSTNFIRNTLVNYTNAYAGTYLRNYTNQYTKNYTNTYSGTFLTNYQKAYTGTYNKVYTGNYQNNYSTNFIRNTLVNYQRNYTGTYLRRYTGNYQNNYARNFIRNTGVNYQTGYQGTYGRNFTATYAGAYLANYTRNFTGNYNRVISSDYVRAVSSTYQSAFRSNLVGSQLVSYIKETFRPQAFMGRVQSAPSTRQGFQNEGNLQYYSGGVAYTGNVLTEHYLNWSNLGQLNYLPGQYYNSAAGPGRERYYASGNLLVGDQNEFDIAPGTISGWRLTSYTAGGGTGYARALSFNTLAGFLGIPAAQEQDVQGLGDASNHYWPNVYIRTDGLIPDAEWLREARYGIGTMVVRPDGTTPTNPNNPTREIRLRGATAPGATAMAASQFIDGSGLSYLSSLQTSGQGQNDRNSIGNTYTSLGTGAAGSGSGWERNVYLAGESQNVLGYFGTNVYARWELRGSVGERYVSPTRTTTQSTVISFTPGGRNYVSTTGREAAYQHDPASGTLLRDMFWAISYYLAPGSNWYAGPAYRAQGGARGYQGPMSVAFTTHGTIHSDWINEWVAGFGPQEGNAPDGTLRTFPTAMIQLDVSRQATDVGGVGQLYRGPGAELGGGIDVSSASPISYYLGAAVVLVGAAGPQPQFAGQQWTLAQRMGPSPEALQGGWYQATYMGLVTGEINYTGAQVSSYEGSNALTYTSTNFFAGRAKGTSSYASSGTLYDTFPTRGARYTRQGYFSYLGPAQGEAMNYIGAGNYASVANATYNRTTSADYAGNYVRNFATSNYTRNFAGAPTLDNFQGATFNTNYLRNYTGNYTGAFAINYASVTDVNYTGASFATNYQTQYTGNYTGAFAINYASTSAIDYQGAQFNTNYQNQYTGAFNTAYAIAYAKAFVAGYTGANFNQAYQTQYVGNYTGAFATNFTSTSNINYTGPSFATNYQTQYVGNYTGAFATDYASASAIDYQGAQFNTQYSNDYATAYIQQYVSNYTGTYTSHYTGAYNKVYTTDYTTTYVGTYLGNYENQYTTDYVIDYLTTYVGNYIGDFAGETIDNTSETNETYTLFVKIA